MRDNGVQQTNHLHANVQGSGSIWQARNPKKARQVFKKRTYTFQTFIKDITRILVNMRGIRETTRSKRVTRKFAEHIMLACTGVNDCVYCSWAHTKMALECGCTEEEINGILALDFEGLPQEELVALAFAQHYSESGGSPSKEAWQTLIRYYGTEKSRDILNYIRMITLGNLLGNSLSAFESRLKGIPPERGSYYSNSWYLRSEAFF